jgi:hypothetical protein
MALPYIIVAPPARGKKKDKKSGNEMRKSPRSAVAEYAPERIVLIDMLERQMLDLRALRKQVAEAETRFRAREDSRSPAWVFALVPPRGDRITRGRARLRPRYARLPC